MELSSLVPILVFVFCVLAAVLLVLFLGFDMLDKAEGLKKRLPWLARFLEKKEAIPVLLLVFVLMLVLNGYELVVKEVPELSEPPRPSFSSADPGTLNAQIAQLKAQLDSLKIELSKPKQQTKLSQLHEPLQPSIEKIGSITAESRMTCELQNPSHFPEDTSLGNVGGVSYLDGSPGKAYLQPDPKILYRRAEDESKAIAIQRYGLPPNSDLPGQPITRMKEYTTLVLEAWAVDLNTFKTCSVAEITFRVNGDDVFKRRILLGAAVLPQDGKTIAIRVPFNPQIP